jgi:hypothetical protein
MSVGSCATAVGMRSDALEMPRHAYEPELRAVLVPWSGKPPEGRARSRRDLQSISGKGKTYIFASKVLLSASDERDTACC